jgi:hypothetical protein
MPGEPKKEIDNQTKINMQRLTIIGRVISAASIMIHLMQFPVTDITCSMDLGTRIVLQSVVSVEMNDLTIDMQGS